jgi:phage terminase small subunit
MPTDLNEEGERFWRLVAGELGAVGVAKRIDGPSLHLAAQAWQESQAAYRIQDINAWGKAVDRWLKLSAKLGLTPADRERLTIAATAKPDEDEERFFKVTG